MIQPIFKCEVEAPSNIAFVKYWGKHDGQIPINPSVSMTLDRCKTNTRFDFYESEQLGVKLSFHNTENSKFEKRVYEYLLGLSQKYKSLKNVRVVISTSNNFPHSAGIASSASGFAAIAMGVGHFLQTREVEVESLSSLARIGSGSASRSIEGPFCLWSTTQANKISDTQISELSDIIVLIDKGVKTHSSSLGHELMKNHPYKDSRINNAKNNCELAIKALRSADFSLLGSIIEKEALELHALMMTSEKPFWLMKPMSLDVMNWVQGIREQGVEAFFTLDAGANIHIISKLSDQNHIADLFSRDFPEIEFIKDQQGSGAKIIL